MADLDYRKTEDGLRTMKWGLIVGGLCLGVSALHLFFPGDWMPDNPILTDPTHAFGAGMIWGGIAHRLKLSIGDRFSRRA